MKTLQIVKAKYDTENYHDVSEYLNMADDELKKKTFKSRAKRIVMIRAWPYTLSLKQRLVLANWLAEKDARKQLSK